MAAAQEEAKEAPVSEKREKTIVAALDFGTTYSGYAYSFKHDFMKDPTLHIGKLLYLTRNPSSMTTTLLEPLWYISAQ